MQPAGDRTTESIDCTLFVLSITSSRILLVLRWSKSSWTLDHLSSMIQQVNPGVSKRAYVVAFLDISKQRKQRDVGQRKNSRKIIETTSDIRYSVGRVERRILVRSLRSCAI